MSTDTAVKYHVFGIETCPTTKNDHLQGYIEFASAKSFSAIKKFFKDDSLHLEARKGSALQAASYCKKDQHFHEFGSISQQGTRSDIQIVKEVCAATNSMRSVLDATDTLQAISVAKVYLTYKERPRSTKPYVTWIYGPPGTGKTRYAISQCEDSDFFMSNDNAKWFDGYDHHPIVIFDEFRSSFCTFERLLRLIDRYPVQVEVKGGMRQFVPDYIYITSCYHPRDVYDTNENVDQLLRRIDRIKHIEKPDLFQEWLLEYAYF